MTVDEELEILSYYLKPGLHSDRFSEDTVQTLKDAEYLGCGLTIELEETLKTMDMGRVYMRSYGKAVPEGDSGNRPGAGNPNRHTSVNSGNTIQHWRLLRIQHSGR